MMTQHLRHSPQAARAFVRGMHVELSDLRKESRDKEIPLILELAVDGWAQLTQLEPPHVTKILGEPPCR